LLNKIDVAFSLAIESLNTIDGFVAASSFDLDALTVKQLYSIAQFTKIVGANKLVIFDAFEVASKSILLYHKRDHLAEKSLRILGETNMAYGIYNFRKNLVQDNILMPLNFLLKDFIPRQPEIERKLKERLSTIVKSAKC
jgi:hypothetical protein